MSGEFVIAIDGPSGTGKSTVAKRVAAALEAGYLDTGAMYRIVTLAVLRAGVDPLDDQAVGSVLETLNFVTPLDPAHQRHVLSDQDITDEIRGGAVTVAVTPVSANPMVRAFLFERQSSLAHSGRMVVEGRDIGTVIAPDAALKIYLTADAAERARRRLDQNTAAGIDVSTDIHAVAADLARRDDSDSSRRHAPLQAAADALHLDSSAWELEDTVARVLAMAAERGIS